MIDVERAVNMLDRTVYSVRLDGEYLGLDKVRGILKVLHKIL